MAAKPSRSLASGLSQGAGPVASAPSVFGAAAPSRSLASGLSRRTGPAIAASLVFGAATLTEPVELSLGPVRTQLLAELGQGGEVPVRRWSPGGSVVCNFIEFCRTWLDKLEEEEVVRLWRDTCPLVPRAFAAKARLPGRRIILLRHGSRPFRGADPGLDPLGFEQARQVAVFLQRELLASPVAMLISSPYIRALQTATPVAEALGLPIHVEWGFGELMAKGWLQFEDPLPTLHARGFDQLPMSGLLHPDYKSAVMPSWPDMVGFAQPGNAAQREVAVERHGRAVEAVLREAGGGSVLVVCHGSTHDFVPAALCPEWHPPERHTPCCVPNCGITILVEQAGGSIWWPSNFGCTPWESVDDEIRDAAAVHGLQLDSELDQKRTADGHGLHTTQQASSEVRSNEGQKEAVDDEDDEEVVDLCIQCRSPCKQQRADDGKFYCDHCWEAWDWKS